MAHRWSRLTALGVVLGLSAGASALHARSTATRLSSVTFRTAVALPGMTLEAGTYLFEIPDVIGASNVVLVRNQARKPVYMGFTSQVDRPAGIDSRGAVTLGEAPRGAAKPVVVWYPPDASDGHRFIYAR